MAAPKKYGLILPKTKTSGGLPSLQKAAPSNVFGDDSDDEHDKTAIEKSIKKASAKNMVKIQTQMMMKKALDEDANVFEYDKVYDDMKSKKEAEDIASKKVTQDRKPRYIDSLIRNAEARKKEDERRAQRKIQKEREEEKEDFGDKEAFVTAAYKKKMEEMQREEEEAKRKECLEEMMDVTKQKDLSGFYRHLLNQQCGEEKIPDGTESATLKSSVERVEKEEDKTTVEKASNKDGAKEDTSSQSGASSAVKQKKTKQRDDNPDADSDFLEDSSSSDEEDEVKRNNDIQMTKRDTKTSGRTYRKRKQTDNYAESDEEQNVTQRSGSNHDDDDKSTNGSNSSTSDEDDDVKKEVAAKKITESLEKTNNPVDYISDPPLKKRVPKDWREMFTKRCIGDKLTAAKERYLERKAARQGISVQ